MIRTILIDDNPEIRELEKSLIKEYFPQIEIIGEAESVSIGTALIKEKQPDLVLLDIEIKEGTGFHILQNVKPFNFKLIFVTAFNDYAIKAIKYSAIDYILKPINEFEFKEGLEKALGEIEDSQMELQVSAFFDHYEKKTQSKKIVLRTSDSLHLIDIHDIVKCSSDNSYTTFYLTSNQKIVISKSIKEYEELLTSYGFFRPHQSHLVNLNFVQKVDKTDGGSLIMKDGSEVPVSARRRQKLLEILDKF